MLLPLIGARVHDQQLMAVAAPAAQLQLILVAIAFIALMTAYVNSDFSVENVWRNSAAAKPLLYKISGVWGNHEGSMVLWVLILALFGASVATFGTCRSSSRPTCSPYRGRSPRPSSSSS
jgi:cytochrome c-type biogenesis protein CcmF